MNNPTTREEAQALLTTSNILRSESYRAEKLALTWQMHELAQWLVGRSKYDIALSVEGMHDCEGLYLHIILQKGSEFTGEYDQGTFKCTFDGMHYISQVLELSYGTDKERYGFNPITNQHIWYMYGEPNPEYPLDEKTLVVPGSPNGIEYIPRKEEEELEKDDAC